MGLRDLVGEGVGVENASKVASNIGTGTGWTDRVGGCGSVKAECCIGGWSDELSAPSLNDFDGLGGPFRGPFRGTDKGGRNSDPPNFGFKIFSSVFSPVDIWSDCVAGAIILFTGAPNKKSFPRGENIILDPPVMGVFRRT